MIPKGLSLLLFFSLPSDAPEWQSPATKRLGDRLLCGDRLCYAPPCLLLQNSLDHRFLRAVHRCMPLCRSIPTAPPAHVQHVVQGRVRRVSKLHLLDYGDGIEMSHLSLNNCTGYRASVNKDRSQSFRAPLAIRPDECRKVELVHCWLLS